MAPFLGVVAAEPAGQDQVSAIVSGSYGGNLVLRDLGVGSHLFLPVAKPGGRMWTGDVHALQGDGVVDQTAIETAAENLEIRYDLHRQVALRGPLGETDTAWIVVAFAANLDDALVACLREVIYWLPAAAGITGPEAYALASMAVSFRVTQYANQTGSAYTSIPPLTLNPVIEPGPAPDQAVARSVLLIIGPAALRAGLRARRAVLPGRPGRGQGAVIRRRRAGPSPFPRHRGRSASTGSRRCRRQRRRQRG